MKRYLVIATAVSAFAFTQCGNNHGGDANSSHQSSESEMVTDTNGTGGAGNDIDRMNQTGKTPGQEASDAINEAGDQTSKAIDSAVVGDGKNP